MHQIGANHNIGLALGGGAVLGAAHIGVLKALQEKEIPVHCISGTSVGSFVASLYAFGVPVSEIEEIAVGLRWMDISGFNLSKLGLLTNTALGDMLDRRLGGIRFEDAKIPLAVVATDIGNAKKVVLDRGDVATAVMAACCVPGLFIPVEMEDRMLVDGGLVENVPISPLKTMGADFIIGVDLNANRAYSKPEDLIDVLTNAIDIAIDHTSRIQTRDADLIIAPKVSDYRRTSMEKMDELIREGYRAAKEVLESAAQSEVSAS